MGVKYFIDADNNYIGGFDGAEPPTGSVEVSSPPSDARQKWNGTGWDNLPASVVAIQTIETLEAEVTPRRIREAVTTASGKTWLEAQNEKINIERAKL